MSKHVIRQKNLTKRIEMIITQTNVMISTGGRGQDRLMSQKDINWILSRKHFKDLTFCHDKTFESIHGLSHVWVGGFMFVIRVSPNDPVFYMHHSFIDSLWEKFRKKQQNREERESQWATDTCNDLHEYEGQMKPFRISNRDGLSNQYTDEWYEYQDVRHCTPDNSTCDSKYLWCDVQLWRCRSKVVLGGNCTGYDGTDICYNSTCINSMCVLPPRVAAAIRQNRQREQVEVTATAASTLDVVWMKTILVDENANGLTDDLSYVNVKLDNGESSTVYLEGATQYPELPGMIYVPLPRPLNDIARHVSLDAVDAQGRYCQAHCFNTTLERYQVCEAQVTLSSNRDLSNPVSYTHSVQSRRYLDVDLSSHPSHPRISPPFIVFACSRKLVTSAMISSMPASLERPISMDPFVWMRVSFVSQSFDDMQLDVSSDWPIRSSWGSSIRKAASPYDPTILFVQAPNPEQFHSGVRVRIRIYKDGERVQCSHKCTKDDGSVRRCEGSFILNKEPNYSDDIYTSDSESLSVLGWDMRGHPSTWRHRVPYLAISC
ncbi:hypothetical protein WR25_22495 [Diploscapter pachys]|uniref:Tyrosinase copper-binding domain-containing protein n=1 Tax=Diploscapter pachys TaxID=2018661 RepID=A0A2A2JXL7_9BILA|nr:hypothetical protein WR25_22495 [Diploscapter pachys]